MQVPAHLEDLAETARDYARGAKAGQPNAPTPPTGGTSPPGAGAQAFEPLPPDPQVVGLYLAACASEQPVAGKPAAVRTIERRLSAITWIAASTAQPLDRADRHIAEVMRGIRRRHGRPPDQKEAVLRRRSAAHDRDARP